MVRILCFKNSYSSFILSKCRDKICNCGLFIGMKIFCVNGSVFFYFCIYNNFVYLFYVFFKIVEYVKYSIMIVYIEWVNKNLNVGIYFK